MPIHFEGIDGTGRHLKPQSLKDPASGSGVRDWNRAVEIIRDMEIPNPPEQTQKPAMGINEAIDSFLAYKASRSPDVRCKARLVLRRLVSFSELRKKLTIGEITFSDLVDFRAAWTEARTTQRRNQEVLKGFFRFCVKSDFIVKSPASDLDAISEGRPKTDPFTREEMERIFAAVDKLPDEYGRRGQPIANQTRAFVLVMRYTGMSIGDTAKRVKADVQGNRIRTHRKSSALLHHRLTRRHCKIDLMARLRVKMMSVIMLVALCMPAVADLAAGERALNNGDWARALKELRPLAERGNATAQQELGILYMDGLGVPRDPERALQLFRLAAKQGDAEGEAMLGSMYEIGDGVPQDNNEAARSYRLAAEQGHTFAQGSLGVMYVIGRGVPRNDILAHMWLSLAAACGDSAARDTLNMLVKRMTSMQIADAQRLARQWKPVSGTTYVRWQCAAAAKGRVF